LRIHASKTGKKKRNYQLSIGVVVFLRKFFALSHIPQRKEKDCLNCGTIVQGHYCQHCGQENVVPHETFWHMVTHFFYDITHFDSSFFHTLRYLLFKPGYLSKEYVNGRRVKYLHPIRMYVFTSAVFFLLFFSVFAPVSNFDTTMDDPMPPEARASHIALLESELAKDPKDTALRSRLAVAKDTSRVYTYRDSYDAEDMQLNLISFSSKHYSNYREYDSLQQLLPSDKRDGWFGRRMMKKQIEINEKYRQDPEGTLKKFVNSLLHRLPYMLFVSLPLFALILKLVYIRRKQFYFFDHGVFTIHLYIFSFLLLLTVFSIDRLNNYVKSDSLDFLMGLLFLMLLFYLYKGMRNFYGQRRAKTFIKFVIVAILSFIMMVILFLLFAFFSAVTF
jgi:Protein of unknown function (DUF3667)